MSKSLLTRNQILECALKMASSKGITGMSIGELAKLVGMSKSGLFAHFNSKKNLQRSVLQRAADDFTEKVLSQAFKEPKGLPRVEAIFQNWITYIKDKSALPGGDVLITASVELEDHPGPLRDLIQEKQNLLVENLEKASQIAIEQQHFKQDINVKEFAWQMYSYVLGYHHFSRIMEDSSAEELATKSFNKLIENSKFIRGN